MSYNKRVGWKDHVTSRPRTYTETTNSDGSKTLNPAMGEIIQQGTAQSAKNFGTMDEAIQHLANAYDELFCITQAELRAANKRITELEKELAALAT